jgi:hypothetical protein
MARLGRAFPHERDGLLGDLAGRSLVAQAQASRSCPPVTNAIVPTGPVGDALVAVSGAVAAGRRGAAMPTQRAGRRRTAPRLRAAATGRGSSSAASMVRLERDSSEDEAEQFVLAVACGGFDVLGITTVLNLTSAGRTDAHRGP